MLIAKLFFAMPVKKGANQAFDYYNKLGNMAIDPQFTMADIFSEGLALVWSDDNRYRYIDKTGKIIIDLQSNWAAFPEEESRFS